MRTNLTDFLGDLRKQGHNLFLQKDFPRGLSECFPVFKGIKTIISKCFNVALPSASECFPVFKGIKTYILHPARPSNELRQNASATLAKRASPLGDFQRG